MGIYRKYVVIIEGHTIWMYEGIKTFGGGYPILERIIMVSYDRLSIICITY